MVQLSKCLVITVLVLFLLACASSPPERARISQASESKPENAGTVLTFSETSATEPEHMLRVIITDQFIRLDNGRESQDYILYDRNEALIYNVVSEEQSIMVLGEENVAVTPGFTMDWVVESQNSHALMRSSLGEQTAAKHHKLYLNNKACYNVVTLENILQAESQALAEYYSALAKELKRSYNSMIDEPCFAAINLFAPKKRFSFGFPYREWSDYGYQRFLVEYRQKIIFPVRLFELPENYKRL